MELIIDSANINEIKILLDILSIDGVTTNPSIITKEGKPLDEIVNSLTEILKPEQKLFIEVLADDCDEIIKEAIYINNLRANTYAKIPCSKEGLKAIKYLHQNNYKTLATAIFSTTQAYLAGKNGADYIAPYVNRMNNYGDGLKETLDMQKIIHDNHFNSKIIGASFKHIDQIKCLLANNLDALTISTSLINEMIAHPGTDDAIVKFKNDWIKQYNRETLL